MASKISTKDFNPNNDNIMLPAADTSGITEIFDREQQLQQDSVRELFAESKVKARTDLSSSQISKVSRIYYLAEMLDMPELKQLMDEFITLRISKDRKSRSEFVEGLKSKLDNNMMMSGMPLRQQFQR